MNKAFLFGGPNNGEMVEVYKGQRHVLMHKESEVEWLHSEFSEHASTTVEYETYGKHDYIFRRDRWQHNNGAFGYKQMEDLNIYFHSSVSEDVIESIGRVILMSIQANWKGVVHGY